MVVRHRMQFFFRPLIGSEVTWSVPGLSLVQPPNFFYVSIMANWQKLFVLFNTIEWVNMVLRILNLEGHQKCMIGSKVAVILRPLFQNKIKKFKCSHIRCLSRGNGFAYCSAHSDFNLGKPLGSWIPKAL